jgi:Xaa-Pro aminopeptidase
MEVFGVDVLEARRRRVAQALAGEDGLVLIGAGRPIPKPGGLDQTYPFQPHPEYYWLTGSRRWGGVLALDPRVGWVHFVRPVSDEERLWEGAVGGVEGEDVADLPAWLEARAGRRQAILCSPVEGVEGDEDIAVRFRERLDALRRPKDAAELALLGRAVAATAAGHARARQVIRPGASERQIQIELEAEMFRQGADAVAFETIVGVGSNAAVLHFQPGARIVGPQDLVLVDAGGEVEGYAGDVTRTYPAGERLTAKQQAIYDLVLAAEGAAIAKCQIGTEWRDVHRTAAGVLALGLRDLGILRGEVEGLLDSEAIALFFPHGVGHMVGLGVRDVGGRAPGRGEVQRYCGARLRVDLPLEEGFLMTVEPGLYFVPALLDNPARREQFRQAVDWGVLETWRSVGGVRIEDNVLATAMGPQVTTEAIPK